jgi:hypothetical protein
VAVYNWSPTAASISWLLAGPARATYAIFFSPSVVQLQTVSGLDIYLKALLGRRNAGLSVKLWLVGSGDHLHKFLLLLVLNFELFFLLGVECSLFDALLLPLGYLLVYPYDFTFFRLISGALASRT